MFCEKRALILHPEPYFSLSHKWNDKHKLYIGFGKWDCVGVFETDCYFGFYMCSCRQCKRDEWSRMQSGYWCDGHNIYIVSHLTCLNALKQFLKWHVTYHEHTQPEICSWRPRMCVFNRKSFHGKINENCKKFLKSVRSSWSHSQHAKFGSMVNGL